MAGDIVTARRLERERRRTLARFLTADEDGTAMWTDKIPAEPELSRATVGECDTCSATNEILHRFEPHPGHVSLLSCVCADAELLVLKGRGICDRHRDGTFTLPHPVVRGLAFGRSVWCHRSPGALAGEFQDACRLAWWLDAGHMPWLCPRCWKAFTADELEHLAALDPAQDDR